MNEFFTGIGPSLASEIDTDNKPNYQSYLGEPKKCRFYFEYTDADKIEKIVMSLQSKDSLGIDGHSTNFLKKLSSEISKPISFIINQSMYTGIFPSRLKIARVIPLFKDKDPETSFENYRPISLLTALSKIFEKVVSIQMIHYLNTNGLFYPNQYGFRKGHSTEQATLELIDRLTQDISNNKNPFAIFLDLSKAFDTLDHNILLDKLNHYGVKDNKLQWFRSYLTGRSQYVDMDGVTSETLPISTGVPQGSILGPLLFLIYINDINNATSFFKFICYADDTTLTNNIIMTQEIIGSNDITDVSNKINSELKRVSDWLDVNKLSLNAGKTRLMVFRKKNKILSATDIPHLQIKNTPIKQVADFEFLGLTIMEDLSWDKHIEKISKKINKVNGVLTKLRYFLPRHTLKTIYNSLVLPHLQFGVTLWGQDCTSRLEILQKQCIRKICQVKKYRAHTDPLFRATNLLKIKDIYKLFCLKIFYKYQNKTLPVYLQTIFPKNSEFHRYATSTSDNFYVLTHNTPEIRKTIRYQIPSIVSNFPAILAKISTHSIKCFSNHVMKFIIDSYNTACPIGPPNCYVCKIK